MWDLIVEWVNDRISDLRDWISPLIESVISWALRTFAKIGDYVQTVYNYVTNTYGTIVNNITNVWETVTNWVTNTYETIVQNISNIYNTVTNYISETYNTFVTNVTEVIGVTIEKVSEWFASIGGATMEWVDGLFVKTENVWNTIISNLGEWGWTQVALINQAYDWVQGYRDNIEDFFSDPLEFLLTRVTDWFLGPEE